ncbi:hypothetical protein DdX_13879 [Ditylenchus destructor]|uniref:Uncharacterized protein n=1 Tax=Ditylenchus destructor TaxID=166010 RepID=A0AAD4R2D1_9BILA|nr:hypothetical protein DdX_13879 [Ditylenchus destructor]
MRRQYTNDIEKWPSWWHGTNSDSESNSENVAPVALNNPNYDPERQRQRHFPEPSQGPRAPDPQYGQEVENDGHKSGVSGRPGQYTEPLDHGYSGWPQRNDLSPNRGEFIQKPIENSNESEIPKPEKYSWLEKDKNDLTVIPEIWKVGKDKNGNDKFVTGPWIYDPKYSNRDTSRKNKPHMNSASGQYNPYTLDIGQPINSGRTSPQGTDARKRQGTYGNLGVIAETDGSGEPLPKPYDKVQEPQRNVSSPNLSQRGGDRKMPPRAMTAPSLDEFGKKYESWNPVPGTGVQNREERRSGTMSKQDWDAKLRQGIRSKTGSISDPPGRMSRASSVSLPKTPDRPPGPLSYRSRIGPDVPGMRTQPPISGLDHRPGTPDTLNDQEWKKSGQEQTGSKDFLGNLNFGDGFPPSSLDLYFDGDTKPEASKGKPDTDMPSEYQTGTVYGKTPNNRDAPQTEQRRNDGNTTNGPATVYSNPESNIDTHPKSPQTMGTQTFGTSPPSNQVIRSKAYDEDKPIDTRGKWKPARVILGDESDSKEDPKLFPVTDSRSNLPSQYQTQRMRTNPYSQHDELFQNAGTSTHSRPIPGHQTPRHQPYQVQVRPQQYPSGHMATRIQQSQSASHKAPAQNFGNGIDQNQGWHQSKKYQGRAQTYGGTPQKQQNALMQSTSAEFVDIDLDRDDEEIKPKPLHIQKQTRTADDSLVPKALDVRNNQVPVGNPDDDDDLPLSVLQQKMSQPRSKTMQNFSSTPNQAGQSGYGNPGRPSSAPPPTTFEAMGLAKVETQQIQANEERVSALDSLPSIQKAREREKAVASGPGSITRKPATRVSSRGVRNPGGRVPAESLTLLSQRRRERHEILRGDGALIQKIEDLENHVRNSLGNITNQINTVNQPQVTGAIVRASASITEDPNKNRTGTLIDEIDNLKANRKKILEENGKIYIERIERYEESQQMARGFQAKNLRRQAGTDENSPLAGDSKWAAAKKVDYSGAAWDESERGWKGIYAGNVGPGTVKVAERM